MATVSVRYIVNDVDEAIAFYCDRLGFTEVMHPAPTFAMLSLGDLRFVLSSPGGGPGGGHSMPDGSQPARRHPKSRRAVYLDPSPEIALYRAKKSAPGGIRTRAARLKRPPL